MNRQVNKLNKLHHIFKKTKVSDTFYPTGGKLEKIFFQGQKILKSTFEVNKKNRVKDICLKENSAQWERGFCPRGTRFDVLNGVCCIFMVLLTRGSMRIILKYKYTLTVFLDGEIREKHIMNVL